MLDFFSEVAGYAKTRIDPAVKRPVVIVGAGGIVAAAHLPAYAKADVEVVGIYDLAPDRARDLAHRFGVPQVFSDLDEALGSKEAAVVDIAVPVDQQERIFLAAVAAGKHVLAQKPFALNSATAERLASAAEGAGLVAAVNQQLRFDEGIAAAHRMVELGAIGEVISMRISVNLATQWDLWDWATSMPRLEVMVHSIHYHDVIRWFLGNPATVYSTGGGKPGQRQAGETRTMTTYTFDSGATALVDSDHTNPSNDETAVFRIQGTHGAIRGTLGLLYDYPTGRPDTLELWSAVLQSDGWVPYPVTQRWFPDAFVGTLGSVFDCIYKGDGLRSSARENVDTIRLVECIYDSMEHERVTRFEPADPASAASPGNRG